VNRQRWQSPVTTKVNGGLQGTNRSQCSSEKPTALGYDFRLLRELSIRPQVALGLARVVTIQSDNAGYPLGFHWAPGLVVALRLPPLRVTVEARRDMVPGEWSDAATFMLGAGAVF
jgi:hypothetical protein